MKGMRLRAARAEKRVAKADKRACIALCRALVRLMTALCIAFKRAAGRTCRSCQM